MLGNEKSYKYRNTQTNELAMGGKSRKKAASQSLFTRTTKPATTAIFIVCTTIKSSIPSPALSNRY